MTSYILYYDDFEEGPSGVECWTRLGQAMEEILEKYPEVEILLISNKTPIPQDHPLRVNRPGMGIVVLASDAHEEKLWAGSLCVFYFSKYKRSFLHKDATRIREMDRFILYRQMDSYEKFINLLLQLQNDRKKGVFHEQNWWTYYHTLIFEMDTEEAEAGAEVEAEVEGETEPVLDGEGEGETFEEHIRFHLRKMQDPVPKIQHVMYTYYHPTTDPVTNLIQKKCILENLRNKTIDRFYLFADLTQMTDEGGELQGDAKMEIVPLGSPTFSFHRLIEHANEHHSHDIIYLIRSDMVLPNQESLETLEYTFYENPMMIYALSRIERTLQGHMFKDQACMSMMYSHEQDLYIYQAPLLLSPASLFQPLLEGIDFYGKHEELRLNWLLEMAGYTLYNDTEKFKVIRIMTQEGQRHILRPGRNARLACEGDLTFLPENSGIRHLPLDQLIRNCQMNEEGEYQLKKWLYERYILPKVLKDT